MSEHARSPLAPGPAGLTTRVRPAPRTFSGIEKAAVIVRLLLAEGVSLPLLGLTEDMQTDLTEKIGQMPPVDRATLRSIIEEFHGQLEEIGLSFPDGIDGALSILDGQISAGAASRLRRRAKSTANANPWESLAALDAEALLPVLEEESNEVGAVLLSKLDVAKAADLLGRLPGDRARRIAYAISQTGNVDPDTVLRIGQSLASQLDAQPLRAFDQDPVERVGAILNFSPAVTRDDVLTGLKETDAEFAEKVRRAIFTFANIPERIDAREIGKVVRAVDQPLLVTALAGAKGADAEAAEFILVNISQRLAGSLREEMEEMGTVRDNDAEAAMTAVVAAIRDLESKGELLFIAPE
jgi:flagellar motor switch protein FliG